MFTSGIIFQCQSIVARAHPPLYCSFPLSFSIFSGQQYISENLWRYRNAPLLSFFSHLRTSLCFVILMRIMTTWLKHSDVIDGVGIQTFIVSITQSLNQIMEFPPRFHNISVVHTSLLDPFFLFLCITVLVAIRTSLYYLLIFRSNHLFDWILLFLRSLSVTSMLRDFIKTFPGMISLTFLQRIEPVRVVLASKLA